jgi:hypothetical protein
MILEGLIGNRTGGFIPSLDHPVDYFYNRLVEILGDGNVEALGEFPYTSPVLRLYFGLRTPTRGNAPA